MSGTMASIQCWQILLVTIGELTIELHVGVSVGLLQQGVQFVRNDKIIECVEALTRTFAIP